MLANSTVEGCELVTVPKNVLLTKGLSANQVLVYPLLNNQELVFYLRFQRIVLYRPLFFWIFDLDYWQPMANAASEA